MLCGFFKRFGLKDPLFIFVFFFNKNIYLIRERRRGGMIEKGTKTRESSGGREREEMDAATAGDVKE